MNPKTYWEYVRPSKIIIECIVSIIAYCLPVAIWVFLFPNTTIWTLDVLILYYFCLNSDLREVLVGEGLIKRFKSIDGRVIYWDG